MFYKLHDIGNVKVCFSKSYVGFDNYFKQVEEELINCNYSGDVILDMLCSNGNDDRFFKCVFLGERFDLNSISEFIPNKAFLKKCNELNDISNLETILL